MCRQSIHIPLATFYLFALKSTEAKLDLSEMCRFSSDENQFEDPLLSKFARSLETNGIGPISLTIDYKHTDSGHQSLRINATILKSTAFQRLGSRGVAINKFHVVNGTATVGYAQSDYADIGFAVLASHQFDQIVLSEHDIRFTAKGKKDPIAVICRRSKRMALWNSHQTLIALFWKTVAAAFVIRIAISMTPL